MVIIPGSAPLAGRRSMRVCVTGGRKLPNRKLIQATLDEIHNASPISELIHGNYGKADLAARDWAIDRGVKQTPFDAEWTRFGAAAGPMRNQRMIASHPDLVVAFPGGPGTRDCTRKARAAGIEVKEISDRLKLVPKEVTT